jgi:histone H3/H4
LWRTYLGALSYYVSGGQTDADFVRFSMEAEESYRQAVEVCLEALAAGAAPHA